MVNVCVRALQTPFSGILIKGLRHIFVDRFLQVNFEATESSNHNVGTDPGLRRNIPGRVTNLPICGIIAHRHPDLLSSLFKQGACISHRTTQIQSDSKSEEYSLHGIDDELRFEVGRTAVLDEVVVRCSRWRFFCHGA
jgi:hypothetical protein